MAYLLLHDNEDTLEAKQNSLAVCALLHRIGILLCNEVVGRDFAANKGAAGMDYALLLFFAEKWVANEGKNGVKG